MLGHWRPLFLRFARGGKMVATCGGVVLGSRPLVALAGAALWLVLFLAFRYASLASMVAACALPVLAIFGEPWPVVARGVPAVGVVVLHRARTSGGGSRGPRTGSTCAAESAQRQGPDPLYFCSNGLRSVPRGSPSSDPDARAGALWAAPAHASSFCGTPAPQDRAHPHSSAGRRSTPLRPRVRRAGPVHDLLGRARDERRGDRGLVARPGPDPGAPLRRVRLPVRNAARSRERPAPADRSPARRPDDGLRRDLRERSSRWGC